MRHLKTPHNLDAIFTALANQHRREVVYMLALQPHTVSQLATARKLSLPAMHKHMHILKKSRLILHKKIGRTRFVALNREAILSLQNWLMQFHAYWGNNQETLENYANYLLSKKRERR